MQSTVNAADGAALGSTDARKTARPRQSIVLLATEEVPVGAPLLKPILSSCPLVELTTIEPAACDRPVLARAMRSVLELRRFLDALEAGIARRSLELGDPAALVLADRARPVREVMTPGPESVRETDTLAFALHKMDIGGYRHLPVVREGRVVGMVSVRDLLRHITRLCKSGRR